MRNLTKAQDTGDEALRAKVIKLLESYGEREKRIAALRFELSAFTEVSDTEQIEAMAMSHADGERHAPGHISNQTLQIALNYKDVAKRLNNEVISEISRDLDKQDMDQRRLKFYVSLLEDRHKTVLEQFYFQHHTMNQIAASLEVTERTVLDIRRSAITSLTQMYGIVPGIV